MDNEISPLANLPRKQVLWLLFFNFLKIATFVLGGGYAILIAADRIFVEKLCWLQKEEMINLMALSQTVPGLMAGNIAIYVGYKSQGRLGALVALVGVALPSFVIILIISLGFAAMPMDNLYVQGAFVAVRSAIGGLTCSAVLKMWSGIMRGFFAYFLAIVCFVGVIFVKINPAWMLAGAIVLGVITPFIVPISDKVKGEDKK